MGQLTQGVCPVRFPQPFTIWIGDLEKVVGDLAVRLADVLLVAIALEHRLPELAVEEIERLPTSLEVAAQAALDTLGRGCGVRAELASKQIGKFPAGHADAAQREIQAPPAHHLRAEDFQALQHPLEKLHGVRTVAGHRRNLLRDDAVHVVPAQGAQLREHHEQVERIARLRQFRPVADGIHMRRVQFLAVFREVFDDDGAHVFCVQTVERDVEGFRMTGIEGGEDFLGGGEFRSEFRVHAVRSGGRSA